MYIPEHFEETRVEVLHELIRSFPLAALVVPTRDGLEANHIPFEIDQDPLPFGTLRGHIARANPLARQVTGDVEALVIFQGPDAYISPSWYPTKQQTGKVVPTWNYAVVHAHGPLRLIDDHKWLRDFVERLTNFHERNRATPWKVTDAPAPYIEEQLNAIIGVEMRISRLIGKWKMSQNRTAAEREGAAAGLLQEGRDAATATAALIHDAKK